MPSDWFGGDNAPVLTELVRHISYSRKLGRELEAVQGKSGPVNRKLMLQLMRAHALQSNRVADLSTRLRLTPQSVNRDKASTLRKNEPSGPLPWNDYGHDAGTN